MTVTMIGIALVAEARGLVSAASHSRGVVFYGATLLSAFLIFLLLAICAVSSLHRRLRNPDVVEWAIIALYQILLMLALTSNYCRSAFIMGESAAEFFPDLDITAITSDSHPLSASLAVIAAFHMLPLPCMHMFRCVVLPPLNYLAFTLPLPAGQFEGDWSRRTSLAFRVMSVCLICFAGRCVMDKAERHVFLSKLHYAKLLVAERVRRASVEHELEGRPLSTRPGTCAICRTDDAGLAAPSITTSFTEPSDMTSVIFAVNGAPRDGKRSQKNS
eukprot:TRINITY_DN23401_c0_g1_i1.p1 TRINITY_DN23401_c0_g1~~TRINITY_DN23401_c0_g1_i1.p1  ORF type:complete len:274 (+),score=29.15 TRINITY_DN23401_c0_g1_i1:97-918(+)